MAANPMHQFQVYRLGPEIKLGNVDLSFTNASLFMFISALTMSRMHRLYGITMPEKGISQLVAVDLEKAEELVA